MAITLAWIINKVEYQWSTVTVTVEGRSRGVNHRAKSEKSGGRGRVVEEIG